MVGPSKIEIFDTSSLLQRRKRAAKNISEFDFLFRWAEDQLLDRLSLVNKKFENVLIFGERFSDEFAAKLPAKNLTQMHFSGAYKSACETTIHGSPEYIPFDPQSFDLIISNIEFHTINDLPGALLQLRKTLKPDGLLIASMFGGETLTQLRQSLMQTEMDLLGGVSPRVYPFADKQDMGALLQRAGYALPVVDSDTVTVTYDHMFKLMSDLRGMGESNIIKERSKNYVGKEFFMRAAHYYAENFSESDGRIPASFEIIFLHGWAPHETQQKPLKPGSAEKRLSDVL